VSCKSVDGGVRACESRRTCTSTARGSVCLDTSGIRYTYPSSLLVARVDKAGGRRRPLRWARVKELPQSHSRTKKEALARCHRPRTSDAPRIPSQSISFIHTRGSWPAHHSLPADAHADGQGQGVGQNPANDGYLGILVALGAQRPRFPCLSFSSSLGGGVMCGLIDRRLGSSP
jgi:hypothetical protein